MEIKGNIGDEIYIKATIRSINITVNKIIYDVLIPNFGYLVIDENEAIFQDQLNDEPKEEPKEEPKPQKVSKDKLKTPDGRFQHSKWLRETIEASGLTQADFVRKLNTWLDAQHTEGKYDDIKKYYATDISNYMNGKIYMSEYKIRVIRDFTEQKDEVPEKPVKMETPERYKKATVESTMAKLKKMRGEI